MTDDLVLIWIDDDKRHEKDAKSIMEKNSNLRISFFHPKNYIPDNDSVDFFLLDDRLYQLENDNNEKSNKRGLTLAAEIRVSSPEIPIYIFSNELFTQGIFGKLSQATEGLADEKILYKKIQRYGAQILYYDCLDYKKIRNIKKLNYKELLGLLNPPGDIIDDLYNALPEVLKGGLRPLNDTEKPDGNSLFYGKWVKKTLLSYPGFLYDSLFSATSVGLQEKKFLELEDFNSALYNGLFSKSREKLWWKRKLNSILMKEAKKILDIKELENPFSIAEKIFRIKDPEQLKCAVCNEKYPETVAYNKDDPLDRQSVHFSCSDVDYNKENKLFFDEIRYFEYEE